MQAKVNNPKMECNGLNNTMLSEQIEHGLVESIQPIRQFVLATAIYHLFSKGIYKLLSDGQSLSVTELSGTLNLDEERLTGLLKYLKNENILVENNLVFGLTAKGREQEQFEGWYTMLIGGYGTTFLQIGDCLEKGAQWASRDAGKVGIGSCAISQFDAIPLTRRLMGTSSGQVTNLLDLGCGNAMYLTEFCKATPEIFAWGVEPDPKGYQAAVKAVEDAGLSNRIRLSNCGAVEFLKSDFNFNPDFTVLGFVLHEILGQEGRNGAIQFLKGIVERFPSIKIIVIEVDNQIDDQSIMQHALSKAYYNPYYLLHYFTNQKLISNQEWQAIFDDAGLRTIRKETTDQNVDSTKLEIGYLLERN